MERIAKLKKFLRIDVDCDDTMLDALLRAGEEYMKNAGVVDPGTGDNPSDLYELALFLYVGIHYENRDGAQKIEGFSHALQSIILQLKRWTPPEAG